MTRPRRSVSVVVYVHCRGTLDMNNNAGDRVGGQFDQDTAASKGSQTGTTNT
jgi:hypothetical protein